MPIISKTGNHRLKKTITSLETATPSIVSLQAQIDNVEDVMFGDFEQIAQNYIRTNQSFEQMYYDDFGTIDKTDASYTSKVNTNTYKMIPGDGGEWRSKMWTAASSVTVVKMVWRQGAVVGSFNHDIEVSADNGSTWTVISSAGSLTNMDKEISLTSTPGTQIIVRVGDGTTGYLERYIIIVK